MSFLFLILDDKIPKFTCVKLKKKLTSSKKERLTSTCTNRSVQNHASDTVILYYLVFNAFYVGSFSEIIFISFKIIVVNNFL